MTALDFALRYAARGLPVLPCAPRGKVPTCARGVKAASTDADTIRGWWASAPDANPAIAVPANVVVLDVDTKSDGPATLAALEARHGALPATWRARTGGGGAHYWFALPAGVTVKNAVAFAPGLDIRTAGGYVVVPPAIHASGNVYAWERGQREGEMAEAPAWLLAMLTRPKTKRQAERAALTDAAVRRTADDLATSVAMDKARADAEADLRARIAAGTATADEAAALADKDQRRAEYDAAEAARQAANRGDVAGAPIPAGSRNDTLFRAACALRGQGLSGDALAAALAAENVARCTPPLDAGEVARIAASAANYDANETAAGFAARVFGSLDEAPGADAVEAALRLLAQAAKGADPIRRGALRLAGIEALKAKKVAGATRLVDSTIAAAPPAKDDARQSAPLPQSGEPEYVANGFGTFRRRHTRDGDVFEQLANFSAKIAGEVAEDDGAEVRRSYEIESAMRGVPRTVAVGAQHFGAMNWVCDALGAGAIVSPGFGAKDHLRCAIQTLSDRDIPRRTRYAHLGWREIDGRMVYLHGGGAIGADGPVAGIEVLLTGALAKYILPTPPEHDALRQSIRSSLGVLGVAPDEISLPLVCGVWRAVLGPVDFALHVSGGTGRGKSEHAALLQQHFGAGMSRANLPLSWSSTANALEGTAFGAADALLTVDDFAPSGGIHDVTALHRVAERLVRNTGNGAGRGRMNADGTLKPVRPPRCLIVSTGEDVPRGASIRARMLVLEHPGVDWAAVTRCQADAAVGLYALAMSGFLRWLAPRIADLRRDLPRRLADLRTRAATSGQHRRTPGLVADLAIGIITFAEFCEGVGALTAAEAGALRARAWCALGKAAEAQADYQAAADPVRRYLELLTSAIASGRAHLADLAGASPGPGWGWRNGCPQGARIGWLSGGDVLLEPDAAYATAQTLAGVGGEALAVAEPTLRRRLRERGVLVAVEHTGAEERLAVRVVAEGVRRRVLRLRADSLYSAKPGQPGHDAVNPSSDGPERGPENGPETETGPQTGPRTGPLGQRLTTQWPGWPGRREGGHAPQGDTSGQTNEGEV